MNEPTRASAERLIAFLERPLVANAIRSLVSAFGYAGVLSLLVGLASINVGRYGYWRYLCILPLMYLAVAIHEGGHFLGARLGRMLILSARVGMIEFHPRRGLWRLRLCRPRFRQDAAGYLLSIPDFSRSIGRQFALTLAGGPSANLVVAAVCALIGAMHLNWRYASIWLGFAALNGCLGIGNLLPSARGRSDGYQLLTLLRGSNANDARFALARLIWCSHTGVTAENLAESDLSALQQQPSPAPLLHTWFAMKAAQNTGDWARALALADMFEVGAAALDPAVLRNVLSLLDIVRVERAFSEAMATRLPMPLNSNRLAALRVSLPQLEPRCRALNAALAADRTVCERWLERCRCEAERMPDLAMHESERRLCAAIRALLPA